MPVFKHDPVNHAYGVKHRLSCFVFAEVQMAHGLAFYNARDAVDRRPHKHGIQVQCVVVPFPDSIQPRAQNIEGRARVLGQTDVMRDRGPGRAEHQSVLKRVPGRVIQINEPKRPHSVFRRAWLSGLIKRA